MMNRLVTEMDLRWLQDFLTLAECGQFNTAAELRHVSQSAFSRRIQSLETWVGAPLIDRSCFPLRLTVAGEQFRSNAAEIVRKMIDARGEASNNQDGEVLRVAMPHCLATSKFPAWCSSWRDASGAGSLRLLVGNVHDSVEWLVAGVVVMMVCFRHATEEIQLDPLLFKRIILQPDTMRLYRPVNMQVDEARLLDPDALATYPYISYAQGSYFRRLVELETGDLQGCPALSRICETDFVDGARELVRGGAGLAWLPESSAQAAVEQGEIVALGAKKWKIPMQICLYAKRQGASTESVKRVIDLFHSRGLH